MLLLCISRIQHVTLVFRLASSHQCFYPHVGKNGKVAFGVLLLFFMVLPLFTRRFRSYSGKSNGFIAVVVPSIIFDTCVVSSNRGWGFSHINPRSGNRTFPDYTINRFEEVDAVEG
ncbi:unnamed protein product, partial [Pylaiella littoralis]